MKEKLLEIGFTENEAKIFEALAGYEEVGAGELSKKASMDRCVTYNILDNLILKGYITYIVKDGKKKFFVKNPESLLTSLNEKINIASELVNEIKEKQSITKQPPLVSIHEGKNALKVLNAEWLNARKIRALNIVGKADQLIPYQMAQIRYKAHPKTQAKVIVASEEGKKVMKLYGIRPKVMPKKYWNETPIVIHDNIVLITIFDDNKPTSIRIENNTIADAFKKDFDLLWDLLK